MDGSQELEAVHMFGVTVVVVVVCAKVPLGLPAVASVLLQASAVCAGIDTEKDEGFGAVVNNGLGLTDLLEVSGNSRSLRTVNRRILCILPG